MILRMLPCQRGFMTRWIHGAIRNRCLQGRQMRFASTGRPSKTVAPTSKPIRIPHSVEVYRCGIIAKFLTGIWRMTAMLLPIPIMIWKAPEVWNDPYLGPLYSLGTVLVFCIPLLLSVVHGRTLVVSIRLSIPPAARYSYKTLLDYTKDVPPTGRLDLIGVRFLPVPIVHSFQLKQLCQVKTSWWNAGNLGVRQAASDTKDRTVKAVPQSWWWKSTTRFNVGGNKANPNQLVAWKQLWQNIPRAV